MKVYLVKRKCDQCGKYCEVDEGIFECLEIDKETGKCKRYAFICDDCLEERANPQPNELPDVG